MRHFSKLISILTVVILVIAANNSRACTSFLVTKGASKDGSTMITYAADSHTLYGELYYKAAASYPEGALLQVIDWDSGKKLIKIPQVGNTYTTVGNSNEWGVSITETTYGGRPE
ncbi:MAG: C69 family dipeptidase, partial [Bacteroidales bacterium]|nr:C69 family dipeptidase [Bacteroidales bacterium]